MELTALLQYIFRNAKRSTVSKYFRGAQICSATAMSVGHGLQDAQKTMGVMTLALVVGGFHSGDSIPVWVKISAALAIAAGTYAGGWRIMKTLGKRMVHIDQLRGVASETVASSILFVLQLTSRRQSQQLTQLHQRLLVLVRPVERKRLAGLWLGRFLPLGLLPFRWLH